jgi:hypothetical protein
VEGVSSRCEAAIGVLSHLYHQSLWWWCCTACWCLAAAVMSLANCVSPLVSALRSDGGALPLPPLFTPVVLNFVIMRLQRLTPSSSPKLPGLNNWLSC